MSRYLYTDHILEAFNVFHRPMELDEVAGYVAEMEAKSLEEVRLAVDNTLTAGWLHGFLSRDDTLFTLECGYWDDEERGTTPGQKRNLVIRPMNKERKSASCGGIQDMEYGNYILSAFVARRSPLTLPDIVSYVSGATNTRPAEVYGAVRSTMDLALAQGLVKEQQEHVFLLSQELQQSL